ncbi:MAG TPA: thrombospondin type 3 repeat-containing protein, partial [Saprospiraceae bacterium]|nr:thrombospondin type 3 repeat-containing protein [Saprospiraceae bacterium]
MKRIRLVFVLLIFPLSIIFSQNLEYKNGIGISGRIGNGDLLNDRDFDMANSSLLIDLNYSRNLTSWLDVKIPLGVAMTMNNTVEDKLLGFHGDILFQLGLFDRTRIAAPYLYLGPSFNLSKDFVENSYSVFDIAARAGLGVDFRITDNLLVGLNAGYTNTFEENQKGSLEAGLGITYLFGQGATGKGKMSMNKLKKLDSDGDGIPDIQDECPHTAGVAAFNGCPDKDNDGIPDYQDKCPDEAGSRTTMGCPDKDGDGVPDKDDKCPDIAGDAKYSGCPFIDSDGDGVPDGEDLCPDQKGLVRYQGCPDTDGDGVPDNLDQCKDKAGPAETNG